MINYKKMVACVVIVVIGAFTGNAAIVAYGTHMMVKDLTVSEAE